MKSVYVLIITGALCSSSQQLFTMYKGQNNIVNNINYNKRTSNNTNNSYAKSLKKIYNNQKNWEKRQEKLTIKNSSASSSFYCTPAERKKTYATTPVDSIPFLIALSISQDTNTLR